MANVEMDHANSRDSLATSYLHELFFLGNREQRKSDDINQLDSTSLYLSSNLAII